MAKAQTAADPSLRVTEIFHSLQGEARTAGRPTTFIRLTGCPLRCNYCDTAYAFSGGGRMSIADIMARTRANGARLVTVTGGEPLAQPRCLILLRELCDAGFDVSLETSGALSVEGVDVRVSKVLDFKTPASGECARNLYDNVALLTPHDQVKFVICDRGDYEWARLKIDELKLIERVSDVLMSPAADQVAPSDLAEWVLADGLDVRVQMQLHKLIWGERTGV